MRIVKLKELLEQPEGTIYKRFKGNDFSNSLEVFQGKTGKGRDFCYKVIDTEIDCNNCEERYDILNTSTETGSSFKLDFHCGSRDGYYSEVDDYFALYETEDLKGLLSVLTESYEKMRTIDLQKERNKIIGNKLDKLKRIKLLKQITNKYWDIEKSEIKDIHGFYSELLNNDIVANIHVGKPSNFFDDSTPEGILNTIEWFLGSYVDIVEQNHGMYLHHWFNKQIMYIINI